MQATHVGKTEGPRRLLHGHSLQLLAWLLLALSLLIVVGVRVRLLDFPLERDEGEYAYAGQLILDGIPPYQLAYNMKMPGTYLAYAAIMAVFGQTPAGIHLGLLAVHLATLVIFFWVARNVLDLTGTVVATASFALMMLGSVYLGLAAHATHFVLLPALLGIGLLFRSEKNGQLSWCFVGGCCFGIAFLMKQPGMFFGFFGGVYLLWMSLAEKMNARRMFARLGLYSLGCLLPILAICIWLKIAGVFPHFWFWTVSYAREYATMLSFRDGIDNAESVFTTIFQTAPLLIVLAVLGLGCLCFTSHPLKTRVFLGGLLVFSFLAVCPGYYFRGHYFIVFVPTVALLAGLAVSFVGQWLADKSSASGWSLAPLLLAAVACAQSLYHDRALLFSLSPREASRTVYGSNPFPESIDIARFIRENTRDGQRIVVLGSEPQIYFYAHRHSSTGYIYTYPLMEPQPFAQTMQEEMIHEIEQNPPEYLVLISMPVSWLTRPESSHLIFDWLTSYTRQKMHPVGLIQIIDLQTTDTVWGPKVASTPIRSPYFVAVYEANTHSSEPPK